MDEATVDEWTDAAKISAGALFRRVGRLGKIWGTGLTPKAIWHIVKAAAKRADIKNLAPHDLRRTCARLCHSAGGELEQIQFLLGHASVQTTEHYLGCNTYLPERDFGTVSPDSHRRVTHPVDPACHLDAAVLRANGRRQSVRGEWGFTCLQDFRFSPVPANPPAPPHCFASLPRSNVDGVLV